MAKAKQEADRPLRSQATRDRILTAARALFAEEGFDRATVRKVADAAGIHASMVMRYYGSKDELFATAMTFDLGVIDLLAVAPSERGKAMVHHFLSRWDAGAGTDLAALLRSAVTHDVARQRMLDIFARQVVPAVASVCTPARARECAALIGTQILGLALTRVVLKLPAMTELDAATIVEKVGATIQFYLDDARAG